jgi:hypothetical protein
MLSKTAKYRQRHGKLPLALKALLYLVLVKTLVGLTVTVVMAVKTQWSAPSPFAIKSRKLTGKVTAVEGDAPVEKGAGCDVWIQSSTGRFNCRVQVNCRKVIYGEASGSGYTICRKKRDRSGKVIGLTAHDRWETYQDSDPSVKVDTHAKKAEVSDQLEKESKRWKVEITLDGGKGGSDGKDGK